jgi:hypothetical protein
VVDFPRFEPIKGEADTAHRRYHGGHLVSLALRLINRQRRSAGVGAAQPALALDPRTAAIEIHERPPTRAPAEAPPSALDTSASMPALHGLSPEETFSQEFIIGSARTWKLQVGLLAALVAILVVLVSQEIRLADRKSGQTAQHPGHISERSVPRPPLAEDECHVSGASSLPCQESKP